MEPHTMGVQVKLDGKSHTDTAILRAEGDEVILRTEKPNLEVHFNYVPMIEFLFELEKERKKIKIKRM